MIDYKTASNAMKASIIPFTNLINATRNTQNETLPPAEQSKPQADDLISQMERLAVLKEKGILSDEEFQQQKQRILNG